MIHDKDFAREVAKILLKIEAVKLRPNEPFTWASGWKSPIYCDNRKLLGYPDDYYEVVTKGIDGAFISNCPCYATIAGVATAGISWAAMLAWYNENPMIYIRSAPKDHGLENLIEGVLNKDDDVVIVEDLISTGGSSLKAVEAVRKAGGNVKGMIAIFSYGFPQAEAAFEKAECKLITLCDYETLVEVAVEEGYIKEEELELLKQWRVSPDTWGK